MQLNFNDYQHKKIDNLYSIAKNVRFFKKKYLLTNISDYSDFKKLMLLSRDHFYEQPIPHSTRLLKKTRPDADNKEPILPISQKDYLNFLNHEKEKLEMLGLTKKDRFSVIDFSINETLAMFGAAGVIGCPYIIVEGSEEVILTDIKNKMVTFIFTHPRRLRQLIESAQKNKIFPKIKVIMTAGEPIEDKKFLAKKVDEVFGARLVDTIGTREVASYAIQCKENFNDYHLMEKQSFFEVLDNSIGSTSLLGQGELIITPYWREDFPLLRYKTGDIVNIASATCSCHYPKKVLKGGILGRVGGNKKIGNFSYDLNLIVKDVKRRIMYQNKYVDNLLWKLISVPDFFVIINKNKDEDQIFVLVEKNKFIRSFRRKRFIRIGIDNFKTNAVFIEYFDKNIIKSLNSISNDKILDLRYLSPKLLQKFKEVFKIISFL